MIESFAENKREGIPRKDISEAKKLLIELEASGQYVFHGSPSRIEELEPRQAYNHPEGSQAGVPDGAPAVAATPLVDVAIFRAIVNSDNIKISHSSRFGPDKEDDKKMRFGLSVNGHSDLEGTKGYVYVLPKDTFAPYQRTASFEWRSSENIKPIQVVEVSAEDLPEDIEVLPEKTRSN